MLLDWVTPLPPEPTDIAEYTRRVERALAGRVDLNLIHHSRATDLSAYALARSPFYNIGNDARFHGNILEAAWQSPGILIAHDYRVQHLLVSHLQQKAPNWQDAYKRLMRRHYGEDGAEAAHAFCSGRLSLSEMAIDFPGLEIMAEHSLCLVTHNPSLAEGLAERTGLYCASLPLPFPVPASLPPRPPVARVAPRRLDLLIFGYLSDNRGLDIVLDMVARRSDLCLHIAGRMGPEALVKKVDALASSGSVLQHGYLDEERLDRLIRDCDLVVNLRNPTMGEVSGSQLRIFANGGLSVVCDSGWYGTLPDSAVVKVDSGAIASGLEVIVDQLAAAADAFQSMRHEGHRYALAHHGLDRFAVCFDVFLEEWERAAAHGRQLRLAEHIAGLYRRNGALDALSGDILLDKAARIVSDCT